ncbi:MAG: phosphatidylserine decarboxylase family protein [Mariprofundaceae bacterium]|nr:phosphatidylserine decarboxylase family protein [Mariprofundaceae bacterium]
MNKKVAISGRPRGRIPLAREGWPFLLTCVAILLITIALCWHIAAGFLAMLLLFMLNFFRDPERPTPEDAGLFISPADGKVVRAEQGKDGIRVDIFMNVFDVHVNRAPVAGRITHMRYTPGTFINAAHEQASEHNERNRIEMQTGGGETIAFTQIAGLVARRIVSYVAVGDYVKAGQRIGMIRFGSRVNCKIPSGFTLDVSTGQRVTAGKTILARQEESGV